MAEDFNIQLFDVCGVMEFSYLLKKKKVLDNYLQSEYCGN